MGRIKKAAGAKHEATLPHGLAELIQTSVKLPLAQLPPKLQELPFTWPFPRGDLHHWIPLLDHFDAILEEFITEYNLKDGPQTCAFGSALVQRGLSGSESGSSVEQIQQLGYGDEADRELVEAIVTISRLLLENSGNRSLYASSDRLGEILNTTSLSLLCKTLRLMSRLAIRYHSSFQRGFNGAHPSSSMRASHYNIDTDRVQALSESLGTGLGPFASSTATQNGSEQTAGETEDLREGSDGMRPPSFTGSDLVAIASNGPPHGSEMLDFTFPLSPSSEDSATGDPTDAGFGPPTSPSPLARSSGSKRVTSESVVIQKSQEGVNRRMPVVISLGRDELRSKPAHVIMAEHLPKVPKANHYEFLNKVRAAKALTGSTSDRHQILAIRILSLTNLVYVYPESTLHQKILQRDEDEPPQLKIVQQLANLVSPPSTDAAEIPLWLKTIALGGLQAMCKHKSRATEVFAALGVNVSHGVLLYILRKTVSALGTDDPETVETHEWNEALVSLLEALTGTANRTSEALVGAGLLEILVEVLKLRTERAERWHHGVLHVLSGVVNSVRDAFQNFVNCKGLDAVSDLISWEVTSSIERVKNNQGFPDTWKCHITDYLLPYFQQQTLRWLFKFVNYMMTNTGAHFDRVLRNLIESPPLLKGLGAVLANGEIFGSTIWSGAVNILSSFIHNEPTSYAVIAEAGLSKILLESILNHPLDEEAGMEEVDPSWSITFTGTEKDDTVLKTVRSWQMGDYKVEKEESVNISRPDSTKLAQGILPATDVLNAVPSAFGAICLNNSGLDMFMKSGALEAFFEVFESPEHVRSMAAESQLPKVLGQHFDELVRHHPRLRSAVTQAIVLMVARVGYFCKVREQKEKCGARLVRVDKSSESHADVENERPRLNGNDTPQAGTDGDVVMLEPTPRSQKDSKEVESPKTTAYLGIMARFLSGYFDNQSLCGNFLHSGGLEFLLDIVMSPCLPYNFSNVYDSHDLCNVFHLLIDFKPHLVLPSIITKLQTSLESLEPLMSHSKTPAFFSKFTRRLATDELPSEDEEKNLTEILKSMVSVHLMLNILHEAFLTSSFGPRANPSLFQLVNLTDAYISLVKSLGKLYRVCVWEEIQLQNTLSEDLKQKTRVNGYGMGSDEADEIFGFRQGQTTEGSQQTTSSVPEASNDARPSSSENAQPEGSDRSAEDKSLRLNVISLRYLLSQIPSSITPFLQGLGKALVPKRRIDLYQRQNAYMVANALAEVALLNLSYQVARESPVAKDRYAYWIVAITSLSHLLIEGADGRGAQMGCLTLVLYAFKKLAGIDYTNTLLKSISEPLEEMQRRAADNETALSAEEKGLFTCLSGGLKLLLLFYGQITSQKVLVESPQSHTLSNTERDRESGYFFAPTELMVELRFSILSAVQPIWDLELIDGSSSDVIRAMIEILKNTLQPDPQSLPPALDRSPVAPTVRFKAYSISVEREDSLKARNIPTDLAREALYRCSNSRESAEEYCDAHVRRVTLPRLPIPSYEHTEPSPSEASAADTHHDSEETIPDADNATEEDNTPEPTPPNNTSSAAPIASQDELTAESESDVGDGMAMSIDNLLNLRETPGAAAAPESSRADVRQGAPMPHRIPTWKPRDREMLLEYNELRSNIRGVLVEKILDILNRNQEVTFDFADLLLVATSSDPNASAANNEMGATLLQSLVSMSADDLRPHGKQIAALANVLALVIQDKDWFESISSDLEEGFSPLLSFVRIMPDQQTDEPAPWIAQTLLILEKMLSEDAQPVQIKWVPPTADGAEADDHVAELENSVVTLEDKTELFKAIVEILPRVGRDQQLALSVVRILAILTREREIASQLAEKRNIQRLFVMTKQLAGAVTEKFQSTFLLILRHMMEDENTIRKVIRSEVLNAFASRGRPMDTGNYIRTLHASILRSPRIFLDVTNEMIKLQRFDPNQRVQLLMLKESAVNLQPGKAAVENSTNSIGESSQQVPQDEHLGSDPAHSTTDDVQEEHKLKRTLTDSKFPVLDYSDGVVHYILSQLLAYKDIDDREPAATGEPQDHDADHPTPMDVDPGSGLNGLDTKKAESEPKESEKKTEAQEKSEQHPIYFYRCFLLQCLAELLMSYSRAKLEFINYSRKADSKANVTPSKPRSVVLNYLLNSLIPIDRLDKAETVAYKKSIGISNWAMSVMVALCVKTSEHPSNFQRDKEEEPDPDLTFVRKFVLEQAFKACRDAQTSIESLPARYAKILTLADLFTRLLNGRVLPSFLGYNSEPSGPTIKEMAKIMLEKGLIASLTSAISDVDMNVDNAKRVVKYVLRPLKTLTHTAVQLSETAELSTSSGQTDEDEISTATSVSEGDEQREETPDLFRHSVLGTLDHGREEESSSESDDEVDEDMYDDYDEGPEYEDEIEHDDDEVMSDEDEEINSHGHVEGLPGDVGVAFEVVMGSDPGGESDDESGDEHSEDDNDDDDEDMDEDEEDVEVIEEITGDDENDSLDDPENEWEDEDADSAASYAFDAANNGSGGADVAGGSHQIPIHMELPGDNRALPHESVSGNLELDDSGHYAELAMAIGAHGDEDEEQEDILEEEDPDEMEEEEDDEVLYPDYDDEVDYHESPFGWETEDELGGRLRPAHRSRRHFEQQALRHHHHQHHEHTHRLDPWTIFTAGVTGPDPVMMHRSHRGGSSMRNVDDNVNPLLQRGPSADISSRRRPDISRMGPSGLRDVFSITAGARDSPIAILNSMMQQVTAVAGSLDLSRSQFHLSIDGPGGNILPFSQDVRHFVRPGHTHEHIPHLPKLKEEPLYLPLFFPSFTGGRWADEAKLLYGPQVNEKTQRIVNSLLRLLVPVALAEEKARKAKEAAELEKRREEERLRAEQLAKEKAEREERERREREEREAREAAERERAEREAAERRACEASEQQAEGGAMEGVEATQPDEGSTGAAAGHTTNADASTSEAPAQPQERVRAVFRGREIDITNLGIDLDYLNALPEEYREEVLVQQLAEQRSQQVNTGEEATEYDAEFLEALPPNIREEILAQEAQDRRRREREEARRQANANGGSASARAEDMDAASFLASLDPVLRNAVLLEQDEEMINQLPEAIAAEARALGAERGGEMRRWGEIPRSHRHEEPNHSRRTQQQVQPHKKPQRKQVVQMLDKAGVATLLRILFVSPAGSSREILNSVLLNASENRQNRTEILGIILSILQDGTTDASAVERSFIQLSHRAKQQSAPKTPQSLKRVPTGPVAIPQASETTPLSVIQHCLNALGHLTEQNPHAPTFFLTEHESPTILKAKGSKKGKARDSQDSKYPINALLTLLDRTIVMDSTACLEILSSLLQTITQPLMVLRHHKEETIAESGVQEISHGPVLIPDASEPNAILTTSVTEAHEETQAAPEATNKEENSEVKGLKPSETSKKQRKYAPPHIPEQNLRLVVNILSARECGGKTFHDVLSTINNLSVIPGAKEIFGQELVERSRQLAEAIIVDLDVLLKQVQSVDSNYEIHGVALSKFSPSSSDQAKLLRVLTALDYIFDPKRNQSKPEDSQSEHPIDADKDTLLASLYESPNFSLLWSKLSECLKEMRQRESKTTTAAILLPLIEALMVVCKNTALKEAPPLTASLEFQITSPMAESNMEGLFFRFTEEHRKVLNDLVRQNPRLMSGTFSLLVKNPKVLEFDNKRNYFSRKLHARSDMRRPQPPLQLSVRRDQAFVDSYRALFFKSAEEIKYGKLSIRFHGEEGVDAGGVTREWFQTMSRQMFNPDYALFTPVASDRTTFHPNKDSYYNEDHLPYFKFIGRIIGKALYEGRALDCHFSRALYKRILGKSVSLKDMETLDLDYYRSLVWMLENDISDIITETFSVQTDVFGASEVVDLIENGHNIPVTEENKQEYVQLVVEYRLTGSVKAQLDEFLRGFHDIVPADLIAIFNEQELELLISGLPDIDVDDWKANTDYHNYSASSAQIQWFWRAVRSFDKEERAKLLQFVTGTAKVPLNGFKELEGMNGFSRFNIHRDYGNKQRLPSSHTCFNQLDLPEYDDYETLRQQLYTAMTAGSSYFGFA